MSNLPRRRGFPVFIIDRVRLPLYADLAEIIANHLGRDQLVQVEDSNWPAAERLRYFVKWLGVAAQVFDGQGRPFGIFADLDALVTHAERVTS